MSGSVLAPVAENATGSPLRRVAWPLLAEAGLTLATVALHFRDPHQHGSWGFCPLYAATGIYCPGCGGLRAVNDLTRGDVGAALSSNVVVVALIPVAIVLLLVWTLDRWRGVERHLPQKAVRPVQWTGLTLLLLFTVARNLPGSWLAP